MAPTTMIFSAAMALLSTVSAAPLVTRQQSGSAVAGVVDASAPMQLFYVPRTPQTDSDGSAIAQAVKTGPVTWLEVEQPDGAATRGDRYLGVAPEQADATPVKLVGGYIQASLPIPLSPTPTNQTWSSVNSPFFSSQGGQVWFTVDNEGADGGLELDDASGALYLNKEDTSVNQPNYAIWKVCTNDQGPFLAFNGLQTQSCQDVYLVGCNNGNCPTTPA